MQTLGRNDHQIRNRTDIDKSHMIRSVTALMFIVRFLLVILSIKLFHDVFLAKTSDKRPRVNTRLGKNYTDVTIKDHRITLCVIAVDRFLMCSCV